VIPTCSTAGRRAPEGIPGVAGGGARLARRLAARLDLELDADLTGRVRELVNRFVAAGLVEAARP
jgi:hypothetical protein